MILSDIDRKKIQPRKGNSNFTIEEKKFIKSNYEKIEKNHGKINFKGNCNSCYLDAYIMLIKFQNNNKINSMNKFELKAGVVILLHGLGIGYSNHNLTDEIAIMILRRSRSQIKRFAKYPDNWEELVDGKVEKVKVDKSLGKEVLPGIVPVTEVKEVETKKPVTKTKSKSTKK
jgi:hypothetical protein